MEVGPANATGQHAQKNMTRLEFGCDCGYFFRRRDSGLKKRTIETGGVEDGGGFVTSTIRSGRLETSCGEVRTAAFI